MVDGSPETRIPAVAIVGRPNVGKSTLFNRLIGDDRSVVHDLPGTTRDAVDTIVHTRDGDVRFVDTAGMRRKSRIDDHTEYYSLVRALRAVDDADVAILVIDATEGVTGQDQRLAERVDAAGCPILVVLNKWDLVDDPERRLELTAQVGRKLQFIGDAPVKVAIEAGIRLGWDRFIGTDGIFVGMHGFGASGTIEQLYKHFGITAEDAAKAAETRLHPKKR